MSRVALVTGANQGLGYALVGRLLAELEPDARVYLSARNSERGMRAVDQLTAATGRAPLFVQLDVTDEAEVEAAFAEASGHTGGLDIVIHNAAARISRERPPSEQVRAFVETNNLGTTRLLRRLRGRLNPGARVVVVASSFGTLSHLPASLHANFDGEGVSLDSLDATMLAYVEAVERGAAAAAGWPEWINVPSKVGQVAAMRVFAREAGPGVLVNAACPGLVDTDASRPWFDDMSAAQSPAQAAVDVVWLATLASAVDSPHGELVQHRRVLSWAG